MVPTGMMISTGRTRPALWGMSGLNICSTVSSVAEADEVYVPFTNPGDCPSVPV